MGSVKYIWNVKIFNLKPKKICFFFCNCFQTKHLSGHCFNKHDIWEFLSRAGINWYWIRLFSCFAVKPIHLWIYFWNFCNFVCMLMNAKERSLNFLFPSFTSLTSLVKKTCRQILFETSKTDEPKKGQGSTVVKMMIDLWCHAQQMFWMILSSVTKTFPNMLVLKIFDEGFMVNQNS